MSLQRLTPAESKEEQEARDLGLLGKPNKDLDRVQAAITALSSGGLTSSF